MYCIYVTIESISLDFGNYEIHSVQRKK